MKRFSNGLTWCRRKFGLPERLILWSVVALLGMVLFSVLFTYPVHRKIRRLDEENALQEARLEELMIWEKLDVQLTKILKISYAEMQAAPLKAFDEDRLLELPSQIEELAASSGVAPIAITPRSVEDGAQVAIQATFQGDMQNLHALLREIGSVSYAGQLDSISILALPDAEQMELQFKVPIQ